MPFFGGLTNFVTLSVMNCHTDGLSTGHWMGAPADGAARSPMDDNVEYDCQTVPVVFVAKCLMPVHPEVGSAHA